MTVLIAGAGIAGLTLGLTLHQIGVPFRLFEAVPEMRPLGVGINIQPNAVRELAELGLQDELDQIGIRTQELGFFSKLGLEIWTEPRGAKAGYAWPQYSLHRGRLQMLLLEALRDRAGDAIVETGKRATGYSIPNGRAVLSLQSQDGASQATGDLLIAADGINSAIRAQMYPREGAPIWNGAILWRATSKGPAFRTGASMIMAGHDSVRFVCYPISAPDPATGLQTINWIAEERVDPKGGARDFDWTKPVEKSRFEKSFANWRFDWLDVPGLIAGAEAVFEYPMIDRDPLPAWRDGPVTLMGDAAHPAYPVGSNGASQAIMDARLIGAALLKHGLSPSALQAFEDEVRPQMSKVVTANRAGGGPDGILQQVEDLCAGQFERIEDVIPHAELAEHAARYKAMSGFAIEELNARPPLITV